jgi:hypothetical protein
MSSLPPRWQRIPDAITSVVDGDLVILNLSRNHYVALNPVGRAVWELLEQPRALPDLVAALCTRFDVTEAQCRQEVEPFVAELASDQLIVPVENGR